MVRACCVRGMRCSEADIDYACVGGKKDNTKGTSRVSCVEPEVK